MAWCVFVRAAHVSKRLLWAGGLCAINLGFHEPHSSLRPAVWHPIRTLRLAVVMVAVVGLAGLVGGCGTTNGGAELSDAQEAAARDQELDWSQIDPGEVHATLNEQAGQQEGVQAAQVLMQAGPGHGDGLVVAVNVAMEQAEPVPDELAARMVQLVLDELTGLAAHNVSVHDANRPGHSYVGGIGRMGDGAPGPSRD